MHDSRAASSTAHPAVRLHWRRTDTGGDVHNWDPCASQTLEDTVGRCEDCRWCNQSSAAAERVYTAGDVKADHIRIASGGRVGLRRGGARGAAEEFAGRR